MTPLLSAHNLAINIGGKMICRHLNLQINRGEVWGLLGPNGSGKTTVLHALLGIFPIMTGNIFLHDKNIKSFPIKSLAKYMALLFQDDKITFPQSVFEYCLASRYPHHAYFNCENEEDRQIVYHALQIMDIAHLHAKPLTQLSGGERRRLAIASVLAQTPQIYLLDEPTNHLDLHQQISVLQHFRNLQDCAVIMSLHDINLAQQFCDHVILFFENGEIVIGKTETTLTENRLTHLYRHPIIKYTTDRKIFWYPTI